jgi:hypothetical protein
MAHSPLIRGLQAGPMIVQIVKIRAIDNRANAELVRLFAANAIEFVLAEKTAIDRILGE